jgi:hypothetical protein
MLQAAFAPLPERSVQLVTWLNYESVEGLIPWSTSSARFFIVLPLLKVEFRAVD